MHVNVIVASAVTCVMHKNDLEVFPFLMIPFIHLLHLILITQYVPHDTYVHSRNTVVACWTAGQLVVINPAPGAWFIPKLGDIDGTVLARLTTGQRVE